MSTSSTASTPRESSETEQSSEPDTGSDSSSDAGASSQDGSADGTESDAAASTPRANGEAPLCWPESASARFGGRPVAPLLVHPRVEQQSDLRNNPKLLEPLIELVAGLSAFEDRSYEGVVGLIDWDHQLPSDNVLLRVIAAYDDTVLGRINRQIDRIKAQQEAENLYPEFDLADFSEIPGDENYSITLNAKTFTPELPRYNSPHRRNIDQDLVQRVTKMLQSTDDFKQRDENAPHESLRGALVAGWAPPFVAGTEHWALELWQVTEFDGQSGKAHVYMIDSEDLEFGREYETDIQISR